MSMLQEMLKPKNNLVKKETPKFDEKVIESLRVGVHSHEYPANAFIQSITDKVRKISIKKEKKTKEEKKRRKGKEEKEKRKKV